MNTGKSNPSPFIAQLRENFRQAVERKTNKEEEIQQRSAKWMNIDEKEALDKELNEMFEALFGDTGNNNNDSQD